MRTDLYPEQFYKDKVHPGEAFRTVWADSTLYRLREAYYTKHPVPSATKHGALRL